MRLEIGQAASWGGMIKDYVFRVKDEDGRLVAAFGFRLEGPQTMALITDALQEVVDRLRLSDADTLPGQVIDEVGRELQKSAVPPVADPETGTLAYTFRYRPVEKLGQWLFRQKKETARPPSPPPF